MKKLTILFLFFVSVSSYSQTREQLIEQYRKERKAMMQQMLKMFKDDFNNDSFFSDDFDPFDSFGTMRSGGGQNVEIKEEVKENGEIHMEIIPKNKNVQLDVETSDRMITIKSETKIEEETKEGEEVFKSYSSSSFSQSIGIPSGYKIKSSKGTKKGIKIVLSPQGKMKTLQSRPRPSKKIKKKQIDKMPLKPEDGEEVI